MLYNKNWFLKYLNILLLVKYDDKNQKKKKKLVGIRRA